MDKDEYAKAKAEAAWIKEEMERYRADNMDAFLSALYKVCQQFKNTPGAEHMVVNIMKESTLAWMERRRHSRIHGDTVTDKIALAIEQQKGIVRPLDDDDRRIDKVLGFDAADGP